MRCGFTIRESLASSVARSADVAEEAARQAAAVMAFMMREVVSAVEAARTGGVTQIVEAQSAKVQVTGI